MTSIIDIGRCAVNGVLQMLSYKTKRKIVIIESDDWGNAGVSSHVLYDKLLSLGLPLQRSLYDKFDTLASSSDLELLFDVLTKYHDMNGKSPIITANTVVANPDYEKIRKHNFEKYYFEPFTQTLSRFSSEHQNSFMTWKEGIASGIFFPQFHGREHLNEALWMNELRKGEGSLTRLAFDNRVHGVFSDDAILRARSRETLYFQSKDELTAINNALSEGLDMFEQIFGYRSRSFIAPRYVWNRVNEEILSRNGVCFLQGQQTQLIPHLNKDSKHKRLRYTGQRNTFGQTYLTRNAFFEPVSNENATEECLHRIDKAFTAKIPAIISTHRINFMGHLDPNNRGNNLRKLDTLLSSITKKWPEVEFMSSVELGELIVKNR